MHDQEKCQICRQLGRFMLNSNGSSLSYFAAMTSSMCAYTVCPRKSLIDLHLHVRGTNSGWNSV